MSTTRRPIVKKYYDGEGDRQPFVTAMFDDAAEYYNRVCGLGSLGSVRFYRPWILRKSGLRRGMTLLDVATGNGQVARAAARIVESPGGVVGLDASAGMLREARRTVHLPLVQGTAEQLPIRGNRFDFVTMAYALRHVADLGVTFRDFLRVLKPGGRLLVLEIARPSCSAVAWVLRVHLQRILPLLMRVSTRSPNVGLLTQYYWDTIADCVPPKTILEVLHQSGFTDVRHRVRGGLLSEYLAVKPLQPSAGGGAGRLETTQPVPPMRSSPRL